ncbi:S24/S26 family peptidase [Thermodesulfobacteriota bacterium]
MPTTILANERLPELLAEILETERDLCFKASGSCMAPVIHEGDTIVVRHVSRDSLRIGAIAVFRSSDGALASHRIVGFSGPNRKRSVHVRADAIADWIEIVPAAEIIGQVVSVRRQGRSVSLLGFLTRITAFLRARLMLFIHRITHRLKATMKHESDF